MKNAGMRLVVIVDNEMEFSYYGDVRARSSQVIFEISKLKGEHQREVELSNQRRNKKPAVRRVTYFASCWYP